jgi:hypothetical protein
MAESGENLVGYSGVFYRRLGGDESAMGGGYALGNSDLDACGEHGNIDSEVCYEDPLIYPLPNRGLGHVECPIWEGVYQGILIILRATAPKPPDTPPPKSRTRSCRVLYLGGGMQI